MIIPAGPEHDAPIAALTNRFIRETAVHIGTEEVAVEQASQVTLGRV